MAYPQQPYQNMTDPVVAAQAAQAQLEAIAQAQMEQRRQQQAAAQQQQVTNPGAVVAGIKGMDALTGGGSAGASAGAGITFGADGTASIAAGSSIPAGYTAVGTAADGGTLIAPSSVAGTAGLSGGAALGLGAAGAAGLYDTFSNKKHGAGGALEGAASGAALGASAGSVFPGVGTAIGAGAGAVIGGAAGYFGNFGDRDKFKTEGNRLNTLKKNGINIPDSMLGPTQLKQGRSKEELLNRDMPADYVGYDGKGTWTNNKFSQSRNEADLMPEDIWANASFFEKFGNDWLGKFTADQRFSIAQKALASGAVREHHGTMDIDWNNKDLTSYVNSLTSGQVKPNSLADFEKTLSHADPTGGGAGGGASGGGSSAEYFKQIQDSEAQYRANLKRAEDAQASAAKQSVQDSKKSSLARYAISNSEKPLPSVGSSGTVRTGVNDLDNILQGVLG